MNPTLLKDLVLAGHRVACKTRNGQWKVFLFVRGSGKFEGTGFGHSIEECLYDGLSGNGYTEQEIKSDFTGEYKIVTPLPQLPQVGDTVEALEICRDLPGFDKWSDERKSIVRNKHIVEKIDKFGDVVVDSYYFPSRQVAKCEPDVEPVSEELEVITLNGKKYIELKE